MSVRMSHNEDDMDFKFMHVPKLKVFDSQFNVHVLEHKLTLDSMHATFSDSYQSVLLILG